MLVALGGTDPALRGVVAVGLVERADVIDGLGGGDHALGEARQRGAQLEDGAGGVAGGDGAVVQRIVELQHRVPLGVVHRAAVEHGQVVLRIADHAQNPAGVGIHGDDCAGFRHLNLALGVLVLGQNLLVLLLPGFLGDQVLLGRVDAVDGLHQRLGHGLLQIHVDGQHHGVAVGGRGVAQLAHDLAAGVSLHLAAALAVGDVGRELILQRVFDARRADEGVVGIALGLIVRQLGGGDLADVAHLMAGDGALGVDAGGGFADVHAVQLHGLGFDLGHRLKAHVVGDGDGQGVEGVHAGLLPERQHLHDHVLVQIAGDAVLLQQRVEQILLRHAGHVEVGAPLAFARGLHCLAAGAGVEAPHAALVLLQPEAVDRGLAVGLDQADHVDEHLGVVRAVRLGGLGGIAVEGDVVAGLVIGQRNHVGIVDGAALAVYGDGLGGFGGGAGGVAVGLEHDHAVEPREHRAEYQNQDQGHNQNSTFVGLQKCFTSRVDRPPPPGPVLPMYRRWKAGCRSWVRTVMSATRMARLPT